MKYDLHEPEKWDKQLEGTVDFAVVDVPYLNEVRSPSRLVSGRGTSCEVLGGLDLTEFLAVFFSPPENQRARRSNPLNSPLPFRQTPRPHFHLSTIRGSFQSLHSSSTWPSERVRAREGRARGRSDPGQFQPFRLRVVSFRRTSRSVSTTPR